eukprot:Em0148g9a
MYMTSANDDGFRSSLIGNIRRSSLKKRVRLPIQPVVVVALTVVVLHLLPVVGKKCETHLGFSAPGSISQLSFLQQPVPQLSLLPQFLVVLRTWLNDHSCKLQYQFLEVPTVLRNVKQAHECQLLGESQQHIDELYFLLDSIGPARPCMRALATCGLAQQCLANEFRHIIKDKKLLSKMFARLKDGDWGSDQDDPNQVKMILSGQDDS